MQHYQSYIFDDVNEDKFWKSLTKFYKPHDKQLPKNTPFYIHRPFNI